MVHHAHLANRRLDGGTSIRLASMIFVAYSFYLEATAWYLCKARASSMTYLLQHVVAPTNNKIFSRPKRVYA